MSTDPDLLTGRERLLLAAVRQVLDPPPAARGHYFGRRDAVLRRVAELLGATDIIDVDDQVRIHSITGALQSIAARPLGYDPEPSGDVQATRG